MRNIFLFLSLVFSVGCLSSEVDTSGDQNEMAELPTDTEGLDVATFAGGCFWCTEAVYERIEGVKYVISGYSGGQEKNPTYKEVSYGKTTHAEAIQIYYDPKVVTYETLVTVFFKGAHDPTQVDRQGPDRGRQYRSVAFYRNSKEKEIIEKEISKIEESGYYSEPIATEVVPFEVFYPAEKYHQDYYPDNMSNPYVRNVSKPKVEAFEAKFPELLKKEYQ
jgi:peptide-methionine (S)-S-oxide reductase